MSYYGSSNGSSYNGRGGGGAGSNGSRIHASKNDDDSRKIFVGGLSWESTADDIKKYFERFGPVLDVNLKINPETGRPRGFGFVLFEDESTVDKVVREKNHVLQGKQIDPKRAVAGGSGGGNDIVKKIFVGGLDPSLTEKDVMQHFSQYGKVEHVELPFDKVKNQRRAFGFITFESEEAVNAVCANPKIQYGSNMVDVKRAVTKDQLSGGRGGRGGSRGRGGPPTNHYGQPGGGYDYSGGYGGGYPGYDYYGQSTGGAGYGSQGGYSGGYASGYGYPSGYGGYDQGGQGGYGGSAPSAAAPSYAGGYDYSGGWQGADDSAYGKVKRGGGGGGSSAPAAQNSGYGYHPYDN